MASDDIHRRLNKDQTVPLVLYKGGERIIIGQATVKGDGSIQAQIAKDVRKELKDLLFGGSLGGLSLDPKPQPDMKYHTSTYVDTATQEAIEVAVIPPLKIQE